MPKHTLVHILALALVVGLLVAAPARLMAQPAKPYQSEMRGECEAEMARDAVWSAQLKASLIPEVHEQEARLITKNNKHVVMAYGALWILTAGFLVLLWMRQRRLLSDIAGLETQIKKAAEE